MNVGTCKSCGEPYDPDDIDDGFCLRCDPETLRAIATDATVLAMHPLRNVSEMDAE